MAALAGSESYFYPTNPHTKTREEVGQAELFDPMFQSAPGIAPVHSFIIEATHPIVPRWRDVCEQTIGILKKARIDWIGIECFRRRQLQEKSDLDDATIVITVKEIPAITDDVNAALGEIHELSGRLFVELVRGQIWPQCSEAGLSYQGTDLEDSLSFATQIPTGRSVGTSGNPRTGTLGGHLELFKDEVVKPCGITCAHVVSNSLGEGRGVTAGGSEGSHDRMLPVFHPSEMDYKAAVNRAREIVNYYQERYRDFETKLGVVGDSSVSGSERKRDLFRFMIRKLESAIHACVSSEPEDRQIGTVFAHSAVKVLPSENPNEQHIADWAVIDLEARRVGTNTIGSPKGGALTDFSPSLDRKRITRSGVPQVGSWVLKRGRTTNRTDGVVNSVESCLRFDEMGNELRSMEFAIVSNSRKLPFCDDGDSGAFVIEKAVDGPILVGLLWGGMDDGVARDKTYFTPIKSVAKDILATTGYHVRLPDTDGLCICC